MSDPTNGYRQKQILWTARRDDAQRRSQTIARLRLTTFLGAIAALAWWLGFDGGIAGAAVAGVLLLAFGGLVVVHARVEERVAWYDALRVVNARAIARNARDWNGLPDVPAPPEGDLENHPYAIDLDIFGHASVARLLGPAATPAGNRTLGAWLLHPAEPAEVRARQEAVRELAPLLDWREHFSAFGVVTGTARAASLDAFLTWAEETAPPLRAFAALRAAVYVIVVSMWGLLALNWTGIAPNTAWTVPLIAGIVLSFATAGRVSHALDRAGAGERALRQYAGVFEHVDSRTFTAPRLLEIKGRLATHGRSAPALMRSLNRILGFSDLRRGAALLHFPIQAFTLWDFHWLFALERWRREAGTRVRDWFDAAGEIDALACISALHHDNPAWCFPLLHADKRVAAVELGHPLIPDDRRVANDVEVGPPGTVLLVTGSNMSGKSTLLRAIGVNAVLAQCGAPACARALSLPPADIRTSIRIQDSLERGVSYFMAALARLKSVVDAAEREPGDRVLLYLLDEILQGTNSAERGIAVQAVARHLLEAGAIGAMTTHDLNVAAEEPLKSAARLVHFTETIGPDGRMGFDYRLRPGIATSRNALRLMQLIGIEVRGS